MRRKIGKKVEEQIKKKLMMKNLVIKIKKSVE